MKLNSSITSKEGHTAPKATFLKTNKKKKNFFKNFQAEKDISRKNIFFFLQFEKKKIIVKLHINYNKRLPEKYLKKYNSCKILLYYISDSYLADSSFY